MFFQPRKTSVRSGLPPSKLQPLFEPDPEFRTEAPAVAVAARKVPVGQVPVPVGPKSRWMQERSCGTQPGTGRRGSTGFYPGSGLVVWLGLFAGSTVIVRAG